MHGSETMTTYRIYRELPDGHISGPPDVIQHATDEEAIAEAKTLLDDLAIEVWDRDRQVVRLEPPKGKRIDAAIQRRGWQPVCRSFM
jgi:hypothetical protein